MAYQASVDLTTAKIPEPHHTIGSAASKSGLKYLDGSHEVG
jgi:hypothetical protein